MQAKRDLHADHVGTIRVPKGHWDAFTFHCQREGLSHKEAFTRMIEACLDEKYLNFAYDGDYKLAKPSNPGQPPCQFSQE